MTLLWEGPDPPTPEEWAAADRIILPAWGQSRPDETGGSCLAWGDENHPQPSPALLEAIRRNIAARERNARLLATVGPWVPVAVAVLLFGWVLWIGGR